MRQTKSSPNAYTRFIDQFVICNGDDHAEAHRKRPEVYGSRYDRVAYLFMTSSTAEGRREVSRIIVEKNRTNQKGFFNRAVQLELSRRPKRRYHFKDNPDEAMAQARKGAAKKTNP